MSVLKKAVIKSYDPAAHKATVQIAGSLAVWLDDVRVATNIPAGDVVAGRQCSVLFLDPSNQDEAVMIAVQGAAPSVLTADHPPIGALYPGVLSTGVKTPQVPFSGDAFTTSKVYCRVTIAPQGADVKVMIRRNGSEIGGAGNGTVTIPAGSNTGSTALAQAIADGDYFDIDITQVGSSPNEGSDLVWLVVP